MGFRWRGRDKEWAMKQSVFQHSGRRGNLAALVHSTNRIGLKIAFAGHSYLLRDALKPRTKLAHVHVFYYQGGIFHVHLGVGL